MHGRVQLLGLKPYGFILVALLGLNLQTAQPKYLSNVLREGVALVLDRIVGVLAVQVHMQ